MAMRSSPHCPTFSPDPHHTTTQGPAHTPSLWNLPQFRLPSFYKMALALEFSVRACKQSHFSHVQLFANPWTLAHQAPLSMGFSGQEHWSGLLCLPPGDLPDPSIKPVPLSESTWKKFWRLKNKYKGPAYPTCMSPDWKILLKEGHWTERKGS